MLSSKSTLFALISALLASVTGATPVPELSGRSLTVRAGPSGSVIYPPGGTSVVNLGQTGDLNIQYQRVNETLPNNQGLAFTVSIDMSLSDPTGYQNDMPIEYGFRANPVWADVIDGHFVPPAGACGTYNLVVTEHQYYHGQVISFKAAAPEISISCGPIQ